MKRIIYSAVALAFVASACTDSPSSPSSPKTTFSALLKTSNENPPITGAEATGTGNSTMTFDVTRNASGNITAATVTFVVNLSGFPPGTPIRIAHIHTGAASVNGAVVIDTGLTPGDGLMAAADGSVSFTKTATVPSTSFDIVNQILANPSAFYFNAHSLVNPGGVVRGQLDRVQ
jgi:CHRD domain-containing protein